MAPGRKIEKKQAKKKTPEAESRKADRENEGSAGGSYISPNYLNDYSSQGRIGGNSKRDENDQASHERRILGLNIDNVMGEINKVKDETKDAQKNIDKLEGRIERSIDKADEKQIKIIETLGIFVALFTFVSIEFQLFNKYQNPQAIAGLTLILLGSLLTFITALDFVLNFDKLKVKKTKTISGSISSAFRAARAISGYSEEIEFNWFKPATWGDAVKIKTIPLIILWTIFIVTGVILFSLSTSDNTADTKDKNAISISVSSSVEGKADNTTINTTEGRKPKIPTVIK